MRDRRAWEAWQRNPPTGVSSPSAHAPLQQLSNTPRFADYVSREIKGQPRSPCAVRRVNMCPAPARSPTAPGPEPGSAATRQLQNPACLQSHERPQCLTV